MKQISIKLKTRKKSIFKKIKRQIQIFNKLIKKNQKILKIALIKFFLARKSKKY